MPNKVCSTLGLDRNEWLSYRRTGIGGSDAAVVMGLNPYRSAVELYADKKGLIPDKEDNEAMRTGRDLEDYVAHRFEEATGKKVRRTNYMWRSDDHPFMIADIDREIVGENAGLECKTTRNFGKSKFSKGEIPLTYYVQCMHYISVMGYDRMYLAVLDLGVGFHYFVIERNEDEIMALIKSEADFWRLVENETPPDGDGSESADAAIEAICGQKSDTGEDINLLDMENTIDEIIRLSNEKKAIETQLKAAQQKVQAAIGANTHGSSIKYTVTWRYYPRSFLDTAQLKVEYPQAYDACQRITKYRKLNIKEKNNDNDN